MSSAFCQIVIAGILRAVDPLNGDVAPVMLEVANSANNDQCRWWWRRSDAAMRIVHASLRQMHAPLTAAVKT